MSRDYFIIMVYCFVYEHYQAVIAQHPIRRHEFAPALTDEEVITIKVCVRQAANLWAIKAMFHQRLTQVSGQATDEVQIIDACIYSLGVRLFFQADSIFNPYMGICSDLVGINDDFDLFDLEFGYNSRSWQR